MGGGRSIAPPPLVATKNRLRLWLKSLLSPSCDLSHSFSSVPDDISVKRLPYTAYLVTVLSLSFAGLAISIFLSVSHYRVHTDIVYQSFCAITKAFNCDTVSQSRYAVLGGLPVSVWGIFGYICFLFLAFISVATHKSPRGWELLFLASLTFSSVSIVFAGVSTLKIGSYCILCIFTYGINFLLLFFTWLTRRRFRTGGLGLGIRRDFQFICANRSVCVSAIVCLAVGLAITWYAIHRIGVSNHREQPLQYQAG